MTVLQVQLGSIKPKNITRLNNKNLKGVHRFETSSYDISRIKY